MRILVADASATARAIIKATLREMGKGAWETLEATDGQEALDLLRNEKLEIDLVIADWSLPGVNGASLLRQLKVLSPFKSIPVLVMADSSAPKAGPEALTLGAQEVVVKPFDSRTLQARVKAIQEQIEARKNEDTSVLLRRIVDAAHSEHDLPFMAQLPQDLAQALREAGAVTRHPEGAFLLRKGDPVEALHIVGEGEVDIASEDGRKVFDILEPGDCLSELSFMSGARSRIAARARTAVELLSVPRSKIGDLVRRFPQLSYRLSNLLSGAPSDRAADSERAAEPVLTGGLKTVPLAELVQVLHLTRKTGILSLHTEGHSAGIAFENGHARHAWLDTVTGADAFRLLLAWSDATFTFDPAGRADQESIRVPTLSLLMDAGPEGRAP